MPTAFDFVVPGYADGSTPDAHTVEVTASASFGSVNADATIRVAAIIVALALVALWALGYSFK